MNTIEGKQMGQIEFQEMAVGLYSGEMRTPEFIRQFVQDAIWHHEQYAAVSARLKVAEDLLAKACGQPEALRVSILAFLKGGTAAGGT